MIGKMTSTLSLMRLQKYSLFQKYNARSATCTVTLDETIFTRYGRLTWKWGLATDFASWLNKGSCTFANSLGSITSKMSSTSLRNITSLVLFTFGQYLKRPRTTCEVR